MIKKYLLSLFFIVVITLPGCSDGVIRPRGSDDMIRETWVTQMNTNPNAWLQNADPWFVAGKPNLTQRAIKNAPFYQAITMSNVRVPDFTSIAIAGDFQVQLVGGQSQNSVYIFGSNADARNVIVDIANNKLMLSQPAKVNANMRNVIVRIGVRNLRSLENLGTSLVMGRSILSDKMRIIASGPGNILLEGRMNLKILQQTGPGTTTVLGAYTPKLNLSVLGNGNVNVSGRVGVENIDHQGPGTINIIGADSDNLCINASGSGLTTVYGYVNLKQVNAKQSSRVYVYWVFSKKLDVTTTAKSIVGLAGATTNLNVNTCDASCFLGQYLRSSNAYVNTKDASHADVSADKKIFAKAQNQSGILYYGNNAILSKFISHQASIITIPDPRAPLPNPPFIPYIPMK